MIWLSLILHINLAHAENPKEIFIPMAPYQEKNPKCSGLDLFAALNLKGIDCLAKSLKAMDINEIDLDGNTPLHVAIYKKNGAAILFLLKAGADLNKRNNQERTPKDLAESLGFKKLTLFLTNIEFETERLQKAVEENDIKAAEYSLKRGATVGTRDTRQDTLLHRAAQSNFVEIGALLIDHGANINARNYLGETPLHSAALRDFTNFIELLLKEGANSSAVNQRRQTALDLAEVHSEPKILQLLQKYSAQHGTMADTPIEVSGGLESTANSSNNTPQI